MAAAFFSSFPPDQLVVKLEAVLGEKSELVGLCCLWTGETDRYGYGVHRVVVSGKRIKLKVHRLKYYLCDPGHSALQRNFHISHLCHNKLCINIEHLSYEPVTVNNSRKVCLTNGQCSGHRGFRECCLWSAVNIQVRLLLCCRSQFAFTVHHKFFCFTL